MAGRATVRWLVRLTPPAGRTVDDLLKVPLSLDVWQRDADAVVAAASEQTIAELERRRLAGVERLRTIADLEGGAPGLDRGDGRPEAATRRGQRSRACVSAASTSAWSKLRRPGAAARSAPADSSAPAGHRTAGGRGDHRRACRPRRPLGRLRLCPPRADSRSISHSAGSVRIMAMPSGAPPRPRRSPSSSGSRHPDPSRRGAVAGAGAGRQVGGRDRRGAPD